MSRAEDDARHLEAHALKRSGLPPAYRPIRARLLLKVEGREAVEVASFEPDPFEPPTGAAWRMPGNSLVLMLQIASALTVEVRELLAEQRAHEEGYPLCRDCGGPISVSCTCVEGCQCGALQLLRPGTLATIAGVTHASHECKPTKEGTDA